MLSALGSQTDSAGVWTLRLGGVAPIAAALLIVLAGLALFAHGWKAHRLERLRAAAARFPADQPDRAAAQLPFLEAAARLAPDDATVRLELAQAHLDVLRSQVARIDQRDRVAGVGDALLAAPSLVGLQACGFPVLVSCSSWEAGRLARTVLSSGARQQRASQHLPPALAHCRAARNNSPLMPEPHLALALYAQEFDKADSPRDYLRRVMLLVPRLPDVWYYSGVDYLAHNQEEPAWQEWRHSLELSDSFLEPILARGVRSLKSDDLLRKLLPEQPDVILRAAARL